MRQLVLAVMLAVALAPAGLTAQGTALVTAIVSTGQAPASSARDVFISLDSGVGVASLPTPINDFFPSQYHRSVLTSDNRFVATVAQHARATLPALAPVAYRDLLTGSRGLVANDVLDVVAHPRTPAVFLRFTHRDVGRLDAAGLHRTAVCGASETPLSLAGSGSGEEVYVACQSSIRILDSRTLVERRRFDLLHPPARMIAGAGGRLFTLDIASQPPFDVTMMSVYDAASGARLVNVPTPVPSPWFASSLAPAPDGARLVAIFGGVPYVIDSSTAAVLRTWELGNATQAAFTSDGTRAMVLQEFEEDFAVHRSIHGVLLDTATGTVLAQGRIGYAPPGMAHLLLLEPPPAPLPPVATVTGSDVTITWTMPAQGRQATDYRIEVGSTPTRFDLLTARVGANTLSFAADNVPPGTYFVRVRAINATGPGMPSQVIEVRVPSS